VAHGLDLDSSQGSLYLCPFHTDKKPSLYLNNANSRDGLFYCFGCKAKGDIISWLSLTYEISKVEAYRRLRAQYGLEPDEDLGSCHSLGPVYIGGLRDFTDPELERLCALRNFSFEALKKQLCPHILKYVPRYFKQSAYVLCDPLRRTAVLRPMDGSSWPDGEKARLAKRSNSKIPIGVHTVGRFTNVMMCEGGPDYLRLVSLLHECGFTSATPAIDALAINCFGAKRVRICAQNDAAGIVAAQKWQGQLETVKAVVDIWIPPKTQLPDGGCTKDLDDLWKLNPNIRGELPEVHKLINLDISLFPAPELLRQS
jgi:hypothetical protein